MESSASAPSNQAAVPRYSYYALSVLTLVNFLNYIDRQVLPAVAPSMRAELGLSQAEIGFMEDALLISFTVLALLFGRLGDRYSRTKLMAIAAVVWSIATALTAITDHAPWLPPGVSFRIPVLHLTVVLSGVALALCAVRALVGIGESSYSTITPTLIADYFPPHRRATALGIFQAAIPMGFALGYVAGGVLAHFFGWRAAFMIVGLPGLITAVIVWLLKEPERGKTETAESRSAVDLPGASAGEASNDPWLRTCWRIIRTPDWLLSTAGYTALTFVLGAFATWASSLLQEEKGMSEVGANDTCCGCSGNIRRRLDRRSDYHKEAQRLFSGLRCRKSPGNHSEHSRPRYPPQNVLYPSDFPDCFLPFHKQRALSRDPRRQCSTDD